MISLKTKFSFNIYKKILRKIKNISSPDDPNKIRIRSDYELEIRKKEFLRICFLLDELEIRYFLLAGTFLGAVRDKGFISWDWDVELGVFSDEVINKIDKLMQKIENIGFKIDKYSSKLSNLKIVFVGELPYETTSYTLQGWTHNQNKKIFSRNKFKVPEKFFKNLKYIQLFGKEHLSPFPIDEYLTLNYGNWKKPLISSDKTLYANRKFTGISLFEIIYKKIIKLVRLIKKK
jgi:hypothetical protein